MKVKTPGISHVLVAFTIVVFFFIHCGGGDQQHQGIAEDAASKVKIPKGAVEIDGTGNYLISGLADMHVHTWGENDLLLYVANGITFVRDMWGSPQHLKWKKMIDDEELIGPSMITASPLLGWGGSFAHA